MSMNDHFCNYIHSGVWNVPHAVNKNTVINWAQAVQPSSMQITVVSETRLDLIQITSPLNIMWPTEMCRPFTSLDCIKPWNNNLLYNLIIYWLNLWLKFFFHLHHFSLQVTKAYGFSRSLKLWIILKAIGSTDSELKHNCEFDKQFNK